MPKIKIHYKDVKGKYKYELTQPYIITTGIFPEDDYISKYICLGKGSLLHMEIGYRWDGPSGFITIATENFMRGSLIHDAIYQLMREEIISQRYRLIADKMLQRICKQDGMSSFRAWYVYKFVRLFGAKYARPKN